MVQVYAGGCWSHPNMTVPLHTDGVEPLILDVLHQPGGVLLGVHLHRGRRDLLRIDQDVGDDVLAFGAGGGHFALRFSQPVGDAVPCDLLVKLIDEDDHLGPGGRGEEHLCLTVAAGKSLGKIQLSIRELGELQRLLKVAAALLYVLGGHLNQPAHPPSPPFLLSPHLPSPPLRVCPAPPATGWPAPP